MYDPPKRPPTQRGHLERLVTQYGRSHGIAASRVRRRLSVLTLIGALEPIRETGSHRFASRGRPEVALPGRRR